MGHLSPVMGLMPYAPLKPCAHPGCPKLVPHGRKYCDAHNAQHKGGEDRPYAYERGYDSRWRKARRRYLDAHPLCTECLKAGRYTRATVVDHIVPHRGDQKLFWDENRHEIYSNKFSHLITADKELQGNRFRSDEKMTKYSVKNTKGYFDRKEIDKSDGKKSKQKTDSARMSGRRPAVPRRINNNE